MNILNFYIVLFVVFVKILLLKGSSFRQLLGQQTEFSDEEFPFFIETYPGNKTLFVQNIKGRNFPLSKVLASNINKHFTKSILITKFFDLPLTFKVDDIDKATMFCCDCLIHRLNCPICRVSSLQACEFPFGHYSDSHKSWYRMFEHLYNKFHVAPQLVASKTNEVLVPLYISGNSFFTRILPPISTCSKPNIIHTIFHPDEGVSNCTVVIPSSHPCPMSDYKAELRCDWSTLIRNVIGHFNVCYSRMRYSTSFRFIDNNMSFICNNKYYFEFPAVTLIIRHLVQNYYDDTPYRILGFNEDNVYFSFYNNTLLNKVVKDLQVGSKSSPSVPLNNHFINMKIICERERLVRRHATVYNGEDSWLGDIFIPAPSPIVVFNETHALKYNYLYSPYLDCNPFVKYTRKKLVKSLKVSINAFGTIANASTCDSVSETANCAFVKLFNSTFTNMTFLLNANQDMNVYRLEQAMKNIDVKNSVDFGDFEKFLHKENVDFTSRIRNILNKTFDNYLHNLFDGLSRNGSFEFKCHGEFCYSSYGGWFSDIFAALIEPFFNVFLNLVIKPIFRLLIEAFVDVIKLLADLLLKLGKELSDVLDDLSNALTILISVILKIIVSVYKFLEARILLTEYLVLFLFLIYFIKNNSIFSLLIILIFLVIFGFERKTQPSILLTLID